MRRLLFFAVLLISYDGYTKSFESNIDAPTYRSNGHFSEIFVIESDYSGSAGPSSYSLSAKEYYSNKLYITYRSVSGMYQNNSMNSSVSYKYDTTMNTLTSFSTNKFGTAGKSVIQFYLTTKTNTFGKIESRMFYTDSSKSQSSLFRTEIYTYKDSTHLLYTKKIMLSNFLTIDKRYYYNSESELQFTRCNFKVCPPHISDGSSHSYEDTTSYKIKSYLLLYNGSDTVNVSPDTINVSTLDGTGSLTLSYNVRYKDPSPSSISYQRNCPTLNLNLKSRVITYMFNLRGQKIYNTYSKDITAKFVPAGIVITKSKSNLYQKRIFTDK